MGRDEFDYILENRTESKDFLFDVKWSSQLEKLADELFICWQDAVKNAAAPFGKVCVVVNDSATENWLKQYFLLDKKIPQVMMNLEFIKLPEFINNWLAAELHGIAPWQRQASQHPYSPDVLIWRIYNILSHADRNGDLKELLEYIDKGRKDLRCLALSEKLAVLYDDYLNSRSQLLRNWEKGRTAIEKDIPLWQIRLYQQLASENSQTYATDYEEAFASGLDARIAFEHGFPRYLAVHIFDIPFMPETTLHLLEKISEAFPEKMTFWHFNPHSEWFGESSSKKEMIRAIRKNIQKQRDLFHDGASPVGDREIPSVATAYDSPEERLFGALASGARAMIFNLCNDSNGRVDAAGNLEALQELKKQKVFLHKCYSPRRELEAIKDGLLHFKKEEGMCPHDAIVLCADWENYAPIIESVFTSDTNSEGYIPVTVAGGVTGDSPFLQSFRNLLSFHENRFEADAVFCLLENPAIRKKYELDEDALAVLRDMIGKANIRWGYDDTDVRQILKLESDSTCYPFTWQRGLDRMFSEFLYGFNEDGYTLLDTGKIGNLCPCGFVEGDRAKILFSLWQVIQNLKWLRGAFVPDRELSPDEIQQNLLEVLQRFYDESDDTIFKEANRVRQTICNTAESMKIAGMDKPVCAEVFLTSVQNALSGRGSGMRSAGDSVLFAPLNCATATPHQLVWICGLNDGMFPKVSYRASYDLIGKHPSLFDVTSREKDAFALLKAVLSSRKQLCFSYVGKDSHTNDNIPSSVLLTDLKDYFSTTGITCTEYEHPMNGYSLEYFTMTPKKPLPPTYSASNYAIAEKLQKHDPASGIIPFPLSDNSVTDIQLNDLAEFFSGPNRYLFSRQGIKIPESKYDQLSRKECFDVKLDKKLQERLMLTGKYPESAAMVQVENGNAPDDASAGEEIEKLKKEYDKVLADDYLAFQKEQKDHLIDTFVEVNVEGHPIHIHMQYSVLRKNEQKSMIFYESYPDSDTAKNKIRLQGLGANAAEGEISVEVFGAGKKLIFPKISQDNAKEILSQIILKAGNPLPTDYPDCRKTDPKEDKLPSDWQKMLDELLPVDEKR